MPLMLIYSRHVYSFLSFGLAFFHRTSRTTHSNIYSHAYALLMMYLMVVFCSSSQYNGFGDFRDVNAP